MVLSHSNLPPRSTLFARMGQLTSGSFTWPPQNSIFNSALKQSQSVKRDLDAFAEAPVTSSPALQGQIAATLASLTRTVDDYDSMAKRELIEAKKAKAQERVKNFRQELADYRAQFDKLKRDREEADATANRSELLGRRGHSSATPDNPYSYSPSGGATPRSVPTSSSYAPQQSTLFGAAATQSNLRREDVALRQQDFASRTNDQLDEFIARGRAVLGELGDQRDMLKSTQRKLYSVANTLGISGDTIRMIERRAKQDKWIFYVGAVTFFVFVYFVLKWLR